MFSVIIPTMWKSRELEKQLPLLDASPFVGEVLLIDNDKLRMPGWFKMVSWSKVKRYAPNENIFVNPAFNLGVQSAKFDLIALQQDDVVYNPIVFDWLASFYSKDFGPIGIHEDTVKLVPTVKDLTAPIPGNDIYIKNQQLPLHLGWAILMVLHRANWLPIEELKIHLGEEWIAYNHLKKGIHPKVLCNFPMTALGVKTTSDLPQFRDLLNKEGKQQNWIHRRIDEIYDI